MLFGIEDHKKYGVANSALDFMQLTNNSYYWSTFMDKVYFSDDNPNNFNYMSSVVAKKFIFDSGSTYAYLPK